LTRRSDGSILVDRTAPGRGAWLCRGAPGCIDLAERRHAFERAFRAPVDAGRIEEVRKTVLAGPDEGVGAASEVGAP
jgi:predicted RNA-binding protein YlxR (DUF448 family)